MNDIHIPPQNIEAEQSVLGAMLIDNEAIGKAVDLLDESAFYRDSHRMIFSALLSLFDRSETADGITLVEELRRREQLDKIGGASYLAELSQMTPTIGNIEFHAKIVFDASVKRKLIVAAQEIQKECHNGTEVEELFDHAQQGIYQAWKHRSNGYTDMNRAMRSILEHLEGDKIEGIPTGFSKLDELTGGLRKKDLVILAGRPSMGKTALALAFARNAAIAENVPVGLFSLEMGTDALMQRLLCMEARLDVLRMRNHRLSPQDWGRISTHAGILADAPIFIDDSADLTPMEIRARARRMKSEHDIGLVIVDYLQLMHSRNFSENRQQEVSDISRSLKALTKELDLPVVAVSQLSRAVESRGGERRPILADLRESGAIEQDADVVMFVYRAEAYGILQDSKGRDTEGIAEIILAKQRNGPVGSCFLTWMGEHTRFENPAMNYEEPF